MQYIIFFLYLIFSKHLETTKILHINFQITESMILFIQYNIWKKFLYILKIFIYLIKLHNIKIILAFVCKKINQIKLYQKRKINFMLLYCMKVFTQKKNNIYFYIFRNVKIFNCNLIAVFISSYSQDSKCAIKIL